MTTAWTGDPELVGPGVGWHDSGLRYCIIHNGVVDCDESDCDCRMGYGDEDVDCVTRSLFYFDPNKLCGHGREGAEDD